MGYNHSFMSYFQLGIGSTMVSNYIYLEVQVVIIYPCVNLKSFMILQGITEAIACISDN